MGLCISIHKDMDPPPYISEGRMRMMTTHYTIHYHDHDPINPSPIYIKTQHDMKNMSCFICGKTNKKHGIDIEIHPFYCEKAGQTAIDWFAFGEFAKTCFNIQTGENIGTHFDWSEVSKNPDLFVDSHYNMIALCNLHHTSVNRGIHHVPFPDWILQKWSKSGFDFLE